MLSIEATTRNDHDVSIQDDADAETSTPNPNTTQRNGSKVAAIDINEDKPTARLKRIADAVERSRSEYKSEDAYTERGVYLHFHNRLRLTDSSSGMMRHLSKETLPGHGASLPRSTGSGSVSVCFSNCPCH